MKNEKKIYILIYNKEIRYIFLFTLLLFGIICASCDITDRKEKKSDSIPLCKKDPPAETPIHNMHEQVILLITSGLYSEAEHKLKEIITLQPEFYGAYRTLGEILPKYKDTTSITEFLHTLVKQDPRNSFAYWALGFLSTEQKAYDTAINYFKQAITCKPEFYDTYESLIDVYRIQGKIQETAPAIESYLRNILVENNGNAEYGLAYLYYHLGKINDAFKLCEKLCAKSVSESAGRLFKLTGTFYSMKKQNVTAFHYYQCAFNAFQTYGDKQGETAALINLGIAQDLLLNYEKALENYRKALPIARILQNQFYEGLILMNTGIMYKNLDDYSKSIVYYQNALHHFKKMTGSNDEILINIYNNLGQLHEYLSDYSRALDFYNTALQLCLDIKRPDLEMMILNNLGEVYKRQMDFNKALDNYEQALKIVQNNNDFWTKAVILNNIGEIYLKSTDYNKAIDAFQQSLKNRQQTGDRRGEGNTNKNIGYLFYQKGEYRKALEYYRKARKQAGNESVENAELTGLMGICYRALKQFDMAYTHLKKSIEMTERFRNRLNYEKHKTGFMRNKRYIYDAIVELLYSLHIRDSGKLYDYIAFEYSEKAKARTLSNLLEESRIEIKQGISPDLAARIVEIDREYSLKNTQLGKELKKATGDEDKEEIKKLVKDLSNLENEYEDVLARAAIENPKYEEIIYSRPISPTHIQEELPDSSTLLISYQMTEKNLFTWCIGKNSFRFLHQPLEQKKLKEKVLYLYRLLAKPSKDESFLDTASELYTLLIKPALPPGSRYKKLIIIPDKILHYLPFEVLISKKHGEEKIPAYLVHEYSIQYVQSATILSYLYNRNNNKTVKGQSENNVFLAIGNPVLDPATHTADYTGFFDNALFSLPDLKPLPFSEKEIREIGNLFKEKLILSKGDAREERIKQPDALKGYSYIHFATHSIINEENPENSGLVLTQDNDPREDGFLKMREIFNLETEADMVVLSACNTRTGEYIEGEGIIGLTRAWMFAGASAVISSLWGIQDESTSVFMTAFYTNIKAGLSFSDALRKTRLLMMKQESYWHPYFWAGFVLIGRE